MVEQTAFCQSGSVGMVTHRCRGYALVVFLLIDTRRHDVIIISTENVPLFHAIHLFIKYCCYSLVFFLLLCKKIESKKSWRSWLKFFFGFVNGCSHGYRDISTGRFFGVPSSDWWFFSLFFFLSRDYQWDDQ